ncbi:MAG: hypothetical protein ABIV51_04465, partial [Saprospiraceae bacterium]
DSIFIFDPIQSQLIPFAWNKQMGEPKSVDIPAGNRLHPMIIVDDLSKRVFLKSENKQGYFGAIEWDLHTGQELARFEVKNIHDGIKNYKIRDGYLYYIANPGPADRNRYLFKSRMIKN